MNLSVQFLGDDRLNLKIISNNQDKRLTGACIAYLGPSVNHFDLKWQPMFLLVTGILSSNFEIKKWKKRNITFSGST
jgi:hypothetical protein